MNSRCDSCEAEECCKCRERAKKRKNRQSVMEECEHELVPDRCRDYECF